MRVYVSVYIYIYIYIYIMYVCVRGGGAELMVCDDYLGHVFGSTPGRQTVPRAEAMAILHALRTTKGNALFVCDNWTPRAEWPSGSQRAERPSGAPRAERRRAAGRAAARRGPSGGTLRDERRRAES